MHPLPPYLSLNVLTHPTDLLGTSAAAALREHFEQDLFREFNTSTQILVEHFNAPDVITIDGQGAGWNEAEDAVIVPLIGPAMVADGGWSSCVARCVQQSMAGGVHVVPVMIEDVTAELSLEIQSMRFDLWHGTNTDRQKRLVREITLELIRYLRHKLRRQTRPEHSEQSLSEYARKVQVFISHSKHDGDGERVAFAIRRCLHDSSSLHGLIDVHDIPAGVLFDQMLLHQVRTSALIAIHTDSYSTREWCRREVIEAKQHLVPMVVADCIRDRDEHCMPYLGGVPVVRMCPDQCHRAGVVVQRLLDEIFLSYLWDNSTRGLQESFSNIHFMYRSPEPLSLTAAGMLPTGGISEIVYSGRVLQAADLRVFKQLAPNVAVTDMERWRRTMP